MRHACLLAVLLSGLVASAQQPRTSESIEVSIVNLDVVVTDRDGRRVTGLTAGDFEIREAGKVQPITNFAEYRGAAPAPAGEVGVEAAAAAPAPRLPRTIVLFVEWTGKMPPFRAKQIYDGMRGLLRKAVAPGDRVMIVGWSGRARIRQPFTDDLAQLESVLAVMEREHQQQMIDVAESVRTEQREANQAAFEVATANPGGGAADPVTAATARENAEDLGTFALEAGKRQFAGIRAKGAALEALVHGISAAEGRKIVIMATRRFGVVAGAEFFDTGAVGLDRRPELDTTEVTESLVRTANANDVTLYSLYMPGALWEGVRPDGEDELAFGSRERNIAMNEGLNLDHVATRTGGLMGFGPEDIERILPRVVEDLDNFYSLGYRARATGRDLTRKVEVRTKNRDYTVRSRTQVIEKSDETRMKDRLLANLMQELETSAIRFEVTLGELRATGRKRWELPLKVRIPIRALTTLPQGEQEGGAFSVYAITGGALGVTSEVLHRTQPFRIPRADLERARASHFTYEAALQVDEKSSRLSIGVLDETSKEVGLKSLPLPARSGSR